MTNRFLTLVLVVVAAAGFVALVTRLAPGAGRGGCQGSTAGIACSPAPSGNSAQLPAVSPTIPPVPLDTPDASAVVPTPPPTGTSFDDEFNGSNLDSRWHTTWGGFGSASWSSSQANVANGVLTITAQRSGNGWVSAELDTVGGFAQKYGTFYARVLVPQGRALWATFWLGEGWQVSQTEIDVMEVCANPPGTADGNDVTLLHNIIHLADGRSAHHAATVPSLAGDWHVVGIDWHADRLVFSIDGVAVSQETNPDLIPHVAMSPVFDLAVGGWCGIPSGDTPDAAKLQVDWIRADP